jgi:hypothetical protein
MAPPSTEPSPPVQFFMMAVQYAAQVGVAPDDVEEDVEVDVVM